MICALYNIGEVFPCALSENHDLAYNILQHLTNTIQIPQSDFLRQRCPVADGLLSCHQLHNLRYGI